MLIVFNFVLKVSKLVGEKGTLERLVQEHALRIVVDGPGDHFDAPLTPFTNVGSKSRVQIPNVFRDLETS